MFCCLNRAALMSVLRTVPAVLIVKDLMCSRAPLEPDDVDRLHARTVPGRAFRVDGFNRHVLGKEIELTHEKAVGRQVSLSR